MKSNNTAFGQAISKMVLVFCLAVTAGSVSAQELGNKYISQDIAEAEASGNAETKAEKYRRAAAQLWKLAEGNEANREARLRLALQYADSSNYYYLKVQERLKAQLNRPRRDTSMRDMYVRLLAENGNDITEVNKIITGIKFGLRKYEKPQPAATGQQSGNATASPEKKDVSATGMSAGALKPEGHKNAAPNGATAANEKHETSVRRQEPVTNPSAPVQGEVKTEIIELRLKSDGPIRIDTLKPAESRVVVEDMPFAGAKANQQIEFSWQVGADAGITWMPSNSTTEPHFIHLTDPKFGSDSQLQQMWNEIFKGMVIPGSEETSTTNLPGWELGLNGGLVIDKDYEMKLGISGGTFSAKAEIPVIVARVVPPVTPSSLPVTQRVEETIVEKITIGNFCSRLTGRIYFGNKIRGYAEAGGVVGFNHSASVAIRAGQYSEKRTFSHTTGFGGGTVGMGISIPLTDILKLETGVSADLLSANQKFAAVLHLNTGLRILF